MKSMTLPDKNEVKQNLLELFKHVYIKQQTVPNYLFIDYSVTDNTVESYVCEKNPMPLGKLIRSRISDRNNSEKAEIGDNDKTLLGMCKDIVDKISVDDDVIGVVFLMSVNKKKAVIWPYL